jgi:hypothetical protein
LVIRDEAAPIMGGLVAFKNTGIELMKYAYLLLILTAPALALPGCKPKSPDQQSQTDRHSAADEEPLLLDDEPLLLSDEQDGNFPQDLLADNSRCHVCHINYVQEDIAVIHARANIGCNNCHGDCDAHIADESWASGGNGTAPDIMYPRPNINEACMSCHPRDKIDSAQHEPLFDAAEDKVCTDCHGNHRLHERRCKWK